MSYFVECWRNPKGATREGGSSLLSGVLALAVSTAMLSGVVFYNGYPLVWPDTGGYLAPVNLTFRSIFYSLFVYPTHLIHSLWPVVYIQSLLTAYLLRLILREVFEISSWVGFLIIIVLLTTLTSLPWYTGVLMPDIFTPILALSLFCLGFCFARFSNWERSYLIALTIVAAVVHFANVPIAAGLILAGFLFRVGRGRRLPLRPRLILPTALLAVSVLAIILSNVLTLGLFAFSAGGYAFELARLQADGQAVEYLRETCETRHYRLCGYLNKMPMEVWRFLWMPEGPFRHLNWLEERDEGTEIVRETIEHYPLSVIQSAIRNTLDQLTRVKTGGGLISYADLPYPTKDLERYYPADLDAYNNSRQSHGELASLPSVNRIHLAVLVLSFLYCPFLAFSLIRSRQWLPVALMATVALTLLLNGFVAGALSVPEDRYGSRVVWLVPFVAIASWKQVFRLVRRG